MTTRQLSQLASRITAGAVVGLLVVSLFGLVLVARRATPVTVSQALTQFRAARHRMGPTRPTPATVRSASVPIPAASPAPSAGLPAGTHLAGPGPVPGPAPESTSSIRPDALPAPGVYTYATTGYEEVSVPGSRRTFPSQTTITVEPAGCGEVEIWQPFAQHTERTTVCPSGGGLRMAEYYFSDSFYGQTATSDSICDQNAYLHFAAVTPGQSWTFTCSSSRTTITNRATVIGREIVGVGGQEVPTIHVHVDSTLSGASDGTSPSDYWFSVPGDVLVKNTGQVNSKTSGSFGTTSYNEVYSLLLSSMQPQQ